MGAKVTGITSTGNVERVTALGADRVIDDTKAAPPGGETYVICMELAEARQ